MPSLTFIDLFAGIGGFRLGMERAGHKCVGFCEIDKYARITYKANFDTEGEWEAHDITKVTDDDIRLLGRERGPIQVICGGFPCQAFSIAGKRAGFSDTRGTLFFEIMRFASVLRPGYLFLENVAGLLNHEGGATFETILGTLDELGYDAEWQVLNSKDFGVPQNRERVFIIGHLRGQCTRKVFPIGETNDNSLKQVVYGGQRHRVYSVKGICPTISTCPGGNTEPKIIIPVLTPDREEKRQNGRRFKNPGEPMFTITAQDKHGIFDGMRIRKLTPLECFRLQGFPDSHYYKAKEAGVSGSQLYKQAGNSVTVNVIEEISSGLATA